jgi:hypothetical protein
MDQATYLINQAPFDRATALMLCRVLDDGWVQIRTRYVGALAEKAGRCNLADGILAYAKAGQRDPKALKVYAVTRALSLLAPPARTSRRSLNAVPVAAVVPPDAASAVHHHAQSGARDEVQG